MLGIRQVGYALVLSVLLVGPAGAADDPVIAPGQDDLLATMLARGETLAEGCKLAAGLAESRSVRATYACPWGDVVLMLRHPDRAGERALQTEQFAIEVEQGSPPESVVAALASRIRASEAAFQWTAPIYEDTEPLADRLDRGE